MAELLGMDPTRTQGIRAGLNSHIASLESVTDALRRVHLASVSPSSYGVASGSLVLSPPSIATLASTLAQLGSAKSNAAALVADLENQINEQVATSAAVDASYYRSGTAARTTTTDVNGESAPWWLTLNESLEKGEKVVDPFFGVADYYKAAWLATSARGIRTVGALAAASDWAISEGPKAFQVLDEIASSPVGKGFAVLGAVTSTVTAIQTWTDPKSTTWDKTRDTITAGLAVTSAVLMFTPLAPVGVALGLVTAAWALGTMIYDNRKAIGNFISGAAKNLVNADIKAGQAVGHAVNNVVNAGKSMLGGLTHSLGIGWP